MKRISVKMARKFNPCFDPTEIQGITEKSSLTLLEVMKLKVVNDVDKVWFASKFMTKMQCRVFAIWCAKRCKTDIKKIKDYIKVIEGFYIKKTHSKNAHTAT